MTYAESIAAEQVAYWRAQGVMVKEAVAAIRPGRQQCKATWAIVESMLIRDWRGLCH